MIGTDGHARNDRQTSQALLWKIYKNAGWNGIADWLGRKKRSIFLPYKEAKKVVNALGLKVGKIGADGHARNDRHTSQAILGKSIKMQVGMDLRIGWDNQTSKFILML